MYEQVYDPVGDSLGLTAIFAVLPLITLFVLLGGFKWSAHWSALCSLAVALVIAIVVYTMPIGQAVDSALLGAVFGLFPIMWIVWNAIWVYNMTEATGHFAVLRRSFGRISNDQRVQAVIIAFCFGALLEALAGFGTPVAITAVMLIALGFQPIKAAAVALVANTVGALQVSAAKEAGLSETLLAAANSSGGVLGKMISPQNLAIGAAAVGLGGREGELFRRVLGWSLILLLLMCVLVYLQSTPVLSWMVV
jgi:lactate permease